MTLIAETDLQSFVLLRLGDRRFAVAANQIAELVTPSRIFRFPHHTSEVEGVIAQRCYGPQTEWVALPVTGDCELINAEMTLPSDSDAPHVSGWLSHAGDVIEVLNLAALTPGPSGMAPVAAPPQPLEARP